MEALDLISLNNLTKRYADTIVLSSISLSIRKGECVTLQGKNGSGKSTLLKIIAGLIPLSAGERNTNHSKLIIGYAPDRLPHLKMSSTEYLIHMGRIARIPKSELLARIKELHVWLNLEQNPSLKMTYYSKGMLQKVNLMQAILRVPDLLILDEPFSGLDQESIGYLITALKKLKGEGTSILAAVHDPLLAGQLESRNYWLRNGKLSIQISDENSSGPEILYEAKCYLEQNTVDRIKDRLPDIAWRLSDRDYVEFVIQDKDYRAFLRDVLDLEVTLVSLERKEIHR